jgi:hypothetical protein
MSLQSSEMESDVPRSIIRLSGVLLLSICIYFAILCVLSIFKAGGEPLIGRLLPLAVPGGSGFTLERMREADTIQDIDILFIGPSQSYRSFDPRWFKEKGLRIFNLGTTAQSPLNTYHLLKANLKRMNPKLVVIAVSQHAMATDGIESFADLTSNMPVDASLIEMACSIKKITAMNLIVAGLIRDRLSPMAGFEQNNVPRDLYVKGGYVESSRDYSSHHLPDQMPLLIHTRQKQYLMKCLNLLNDVNIPAVTLSTPITSETISKISNYVENQNELQKLMNEKKVPYVDLSYSVPLLWNEHFFDELHLNPKGVAITGAYVHRWLEERGLLPPMRHNNNP